MVAERGGKWGGEVERAAWGWSWSAAKGGEGEGAHSDLKFICDFQVAVIFLGGLGEAQHDRDIDRDIDRDRDKKKFGVIDLDL